MVVKLNSGVDYRGNDAAMPRLTLSTYHTWTIRLDCTLTTRCTFVVFTGVLACLDGYMNIAIEQTEEYVNGQLKNKYGDAFLRGNNGKNVSG